VFCFVDEGVGKIVDALTDSQMCAPSRRRVCRCFPTLAARVSKLIRARFRPSQVGEHDLVLPVGQRWTLLHWRQPHSQ
jgi:hypothetical protein